MRSRVTNLKPHLRFSATTGEFIDLLVHFLCEEYAPAVPPVPQDEEIDALFARNASKEWLFPERELVAGYTLRQKKRFPFGSVEIMLSMHNDTVRDAMICGDFFGSAPTEELESALAGKTLSQIRENAVDFDAARYIFGMSAEDFLALLEF